MPVLGAIDVGTNAIRLLVASVNGNNGVTLVENVRDPVRLGQEVFTGGMISEETIERAAEAFRKFRIVLDTHSVKWVRAVATSAAREALNKDLFIDRVFRASNIELDIIGPEEEARLIHLAVAERVDLKNALALLIDIGGGSAEITLVEDGEILATESFRMGAVRLLQVLEEKKHGAKRFQQLVREYAEAAHRRIEQEIGKRKISLFIGTGGNIEALGALRTQILGKEKATELSVEELDSLLATLQEMTFEERIQKLLLRPDRADVIVPAAIVLQRVAKIASIKQIQIPGVGLKDGLLIDMIGDLYGEKKHVRRNQVVSSALQVGRKYMFDEQHGQLTARFALKLFDGTQELHGLKSEHRLLLEVAALLHDIGQFVGVSDHHKHSHYLLTVTPVIGLSHDQMMIIANVARYHRKSFPKSHHESYASLPARDRVTVSKLAALLRLADALDTEHGGRVTDVVVKYEKPKLMLHLKGEGDMLLEKWALARKAGFCEEVLNVKIVVENGG